MSFFIEIKLPQNLDKNINSLLISTKEFLPKNSSKKNSPKNPPKKYLPKKSSKKVLLKNSPPKSKNFPSNISKNFQDPIPYIALGGRKPFRACLTGWLISPCILLKLNWLTSNQSHYVEVAQGGVSNRAIHNWLWVSSLLFAKIQFKFYF